MDTKPDSENLQEIDLSSLASLDFNPAWAAADAKKINFERHAQADSRNGNRRPPRKEFKHDSAPRDRRPPRAPRKAGERQEEGGGAHPSASRQLSWRSWRDR